MAINEMQKWQKEIERNRESAKLKKQKRRDYRDEANAGVYDNGRDHYIDENGNYREDIDIPQWFKNLSKAWQSNRLLGAQRRREQTKHVKDVTEDWNDWCDGRVEMLGKEYDPRTLKRKPGRPRLPDHLKKQNPTKVKRSDQMKALLLDHNIVVGDDGSLHSEDGLYVGWKFQINGRVRFEEEDPVSVHKFLTLI